LGQVCSINDTAVGTGVMHKDYWFLGCDIVQFDVNLGAVM